MKIFIREISGVKFFPVHALREPSVTTYMEGIGNGLCTVEFIVLQCLYFPAKGVAFRR